MSRNTSTSRSHSFGRKPAITSSSRSNRGRVASARATSSRLRSGRVSEAAGRSRFAARPSFSRIWRDSLFAPGTDASLCRAPTMTLSRTLRPAKGFTIWKVRPMPAAQTWSGLNPWMGEPLKRMEPESGAYTPAIMLKMVVLPAPLGPMRPLMSPSGISNEALFTARRPRNDLLMPRTSSSAIRALLPEKLHEGDDRGDPEKWDHQQQIDADVAIAGTQNACLHQRLVQRVAGPQQRGDQRRRPAPVEIHRAEEGRRDQREPRKREVAEEGKKQQVFPFHVHRRSFLASAGQMPCGRNITTTSSTTP